MAVFAQFSSELDKSTQQLLARGERLTEMLKQPQYAPLPVSDQVVLLYAVVSHKLDKMPAGKIQNFKSGFLEYVHTRYGDILRRIEAEGVLDDDMAAALDGAIDEYLPELLPPDNGEPDKNAEA
jgi:F-type H+-transporting ATPase subunit alpha